MNSTPPLAAEAMLAMPAFYRSEAFAEDLLELIAPLPQSAPRVPARPARGQTHAATAQIESRERASGAPRSDVRRWGWLAGLQGLGRQGA